MSIDKCEDKVLSEQFLAFFLNQTLYGLPILQVDGIIGLPVITPLPKSPTYVKGVINLRGQIIPAIDLRLALNMQERDYDEQTCIIVVKISFQNTEKLVGFIVDIVSEVFDILLENIEDPPHYGTAVDGEFLRGIGKAKDKIIMLLNIGSILEADEAVKLLKANFNDLNDLDELVTK